MSILASFWQNAIQLQVSASLVILVAYYDKRMVFRNIKHYGIIFSIGNTPLSPANLIAKL